MSYLLSHGVNDDIVPITTSRDMYKKIKINTESLCQLHEFNGAHEIDPEFIFIIRKKLKCIFKQKRIHILQFLPNRLLIIQALQKSFPLQFLQQQFSKKEIRNDSLPRIER